MTAFDDALEQLTQRALSELGQANDETALEEWHTAILGRKGALADQMRTLGQLPASDRPAAGQSANIAKQRIESAYADIKTLAVPTAKF